MSLGADAETLEKELQNAEQRIKKLQAHKREAEGRPDQSNVGETVRRLEQNIARLHERVELIKKELG